MSRQRYAVTGISHGIGAEIAMALGLAATELRGSTWLSLQLVSTTSYISIFPTRRRSCRLCPGSRRCTRSSDDGRRASMVTSRQFKSALIAALIFAASAYPGQAQPVSQAPAGNAVPVTADNFNRAETDMYFGKRVKRGGIGHLSHSRELYLTDSPVVRPNRDTLYSGAVFDYDAGPVTITLPDAGNRFLSMQVIDEDQYTHAVYYGAGRYTMIREEMGTRYGSLVIRILANPKDPEEMKQVHALQDAIKVEQKSSGKYETPNFDPVSQQKVRDALLALGTTILDNKRMFGTRSEVDPVRHLIGSAMLWGGLPEKDALYLNITPANNDGAAVTSSTSRTYPSMASGQSP